MSRFTPLPELPTSFEDEGTFAWQFTPTTYLDQEKVGVDVGYTMRVARAAGLGNILVRGYFGSSSSYNAESQSITGINPDGSATGSARFSVTRAETQRSSVDNEQPQLFPTHHWPSATIDINRDELASRISTRVQDGKSTEEAWAHELNRSLKLGMLSAAAEKLKHDANSALEPYVTVCMAAALGFDLAVSIPITALTTLGLWHISCLGTASVMHKRIFGHTLIERKRWSISPTVVQPDRFLLAAGMLTANRLVRTL